MTADAGPEPGLARASVAAAVLSDGRRAGAVLLADAGSRFQTDGSVVLVPAAVRHPAELLCGIALQCSPTKDLLATDGLAGRPARARRALAWAEGRIALGWATARWPRLGDAFGALLPGVEPAGWDGEPATLWSAAARLERAAGLGEPPPLFGVLPGAPNRDLPAGIGRRVEARLPWAVRFRRNETGVHHVPVAGDGGGTRADAAEGCAEADGGRRLPREGIAYDEWDHRRGAYRRAWVRVLESPAPAAGEAPAGHPIHLILPPEPARRWAGRLPQGSDIDIDAYVESRAGPAEPPDQRRIYKELVPSNGDIAFGLLLDGSASIRGPHASPRRLEVAIARSLGAALDTRRDRWGAFVFRSQSRARVEVHVLKDFTATGGLSSSSDRLRPHGATRLGAALRHVAVRLEAAPAERRVLLSIGDARPYDEGYEGRYAEADVHKAVTEARARGLVVFHLSVAGRGRRADALFGPGHHLAVRTRRDLAAALARIYQRLEE